MVLVKDVARDAAQRALRTHWDGVLPVDPARIALALGMKVWRANLPDDQSGVIIKRANEPAEIFLNGNEPPLRQNFTCAHELGHWFERDRQKDDEYSFVDFRGGAPRDAHEWFAEHFAANLIMPTKQFIAAVDEGLSERELTERFAASSAAVRSRLRNLKLATVDG